MNNNELILTLSDLLDKKLKPIEHRILNIDLQLENNILPRLQNIEIKTSNNFINKIIL